MELCDLDLFPMAVIERRFQPVEVIDTDDDERAVPLRAGRARTQR
jgi:hypothetical protein